MKYKALIISAALLAAPALALAEDGANDGHTLPPQGGMMQIQAGAHVELRGGEGHSGMMATSTPDGRPLPGMHNEGTTTNPGRGMGDKRGEMHGSMMGSSTEDRPRMHGDDRPGMMGSSTGERGSHDGMGTSTQPRPGVKAFFSHLFNFFSSHHDDASTTPHMDGDAGMMASTSMDASTTPPAPKGIASFLQHIFSFFH